MIKDTEAVSLEEEQEGVAPVDDMEEDEKGSGQGVEHGSAAAVLDELLIRSVSIESCLAVVKYLP